jgi:hypothetical protein
LDSAKKKFQSLRTLPRLPMNFFHAYIFANGKKVRKMCMRKMVKNIYDKKKCYAQVEVNFHSSFFYFFFLYIKKSKRTQEDGLNQLWESFSFLTDAKKNTFLKQSLGPGEEVSVSKVHL